MLNTAVTALVDFENRHRHQLNAALADAAELRRRLDEAMRSAHRVEQLLDTADPVYRRYRSVEVAATAFAEARAALATENMAPRLLESRSTADRLQGAAVELHRALTAAPGRALQAQRAIASVRTLHEAVVHRASNVRLNYSTLLREFPAASSEDLSSNEVRSAGELAAASNLIERAAGAAADGPEEALSFATAARGHLSIAAELTDGVANRLELLRRVRDDPAAKERRVRFEVRDAQRLAVALNVVEEWASVLDAQVHRVDYIVSGIDVPRPDYLAYAKALDAVSDFVAATVERIRVGARQ